MVHHLGLRLPRPHYLVENVDEEILLARWGGESHCHILSPKTETTSWTGTHCSYSFGNCSGWTAGAALSGEWAHECSVWQRKHRSLRRGGTLPLGWWLWIWGEEGPVSQNISVRLILDWIPSPAPSSPFSHLFSSLTTSQGSSSSWPRATPGHGSRNAPSFHWALWWQSQKTNSSLSICQISNAFPSRSLGGKKKKSFGKASSLWTKRNLTIFWLRETKRE